MELPLSAPRGAANPTQASRNCGFYPVVAVRRAGAHCPEFLLGATTTHPAWTGLCDQEGGSFLPPALPTLPAPLKLSCAHIPPPPRGLSFHRHTFSSDTRLYGAPRWHGPGLGHSPGAWTCPNRAASQVGRCHQRPGLATSGTRGIKAGGKQGLPLCPGAVVAARHRTEGKHQLWKEARSQ